MKTWQRRRITYRARQVGIVVSIRRGVTYNAPEYTVGRGATIDLFILLIRACMSCIYDKIETK